MIKNPIIETITPSIILPAVTKATPADIKPIAIPSNASTVIVVFIDLKKKIARKFIL